MNTPIMETEDEIKWLESELAALKLLHEQQTQSLLTARIEAKLVADELESFILNRTHEPIRRLISRLRRIAEGK